MLSNVFRNRITPIAWRRAGQSAKLAGGKNRINWRHAMKFFMSLTYPN
jgi:hypothetical protein